jgi:hypothetical protein
MMILIATESGINLCRKSASGGWEVFRDGLAGVQVTSVIARDGVILAGTRDGIYRSDDYGVSWREASKGLEDRLVRWMAFHPDQSDFELAGTEPAGIYVSRDGGERWRACPEVVEMRKRFQWYLPYSPKAGCVRGFSYNGNHAYAAVEVGGVLTSQDGGKSWSLVKGSTGSPHSSPPPRVDPDVHSIQAHPVSDRLVFAPTGGGFYRSKDGGDTWELLYRCYCRAVWVDPEDPDRIILGPADGVDRRGRIEMSNDGGRVWTLASGGLNTPWSNHMVERFIQVGDELMAVLSNGELLSCSIRLLDWVRILPQVGGVAAISEMIE